MRDKILRIKLIFLIITTNLSFNLFCIYDEIIFRRVKGEGLYLAMPAVLTGMGHIRAFQAIEKALAELSQGVEIKNTDPLSYYSPRVPELVNQLYLWLIKSPFRGFWGALYESRLISYPDSPFRKLISQIYASAIQRLLKDFSPQLLVSTHPLITAGMALLKRRGLIDKPLISIATDFDLHPIGINEEVDVYVVPDESIKEYLQAWGVPEEKIKVLGIPIDPVFAQELPKTRARRILGLKEDIPVLLISGGGFGIGPMEEIVSSFKDYQKPLQLLVVTGRNEALRERLKVMKDKLGIDITIFGYVENMHELMSASDLIVGKPGGVTISEALAKKLPLILVEPVLGQEERNLEFALKKKVALYAEKMEEIPQMVNYLLSHPAEMDKMRSSAEKISHPNSAYEIARLLIEMAGKDI